MKVVAFADMHGHLDFDIPDGDLYLIGGDICPATDHGYAFQLDWLHTTFRAFLGRLGIEKVFWVGGNHDLVLEGRSCPLGDDLRSCYLQDEVMERAGLKVWGSPWSKPFNRWAFQLEENIADLIYRHIPEDVDIVISHGPPWKHGEKVFHGTRMNGTPIVPEFTRHTGSKVLFNKLLELQPKLVVTGHIHESAGIYPIEHQKTIVANCSVLDGNYEMKNKPKLFEIKEGEVSILSV